jgi:hypothetical protein
MAARNLVNIWVAYGGRVVYDENKIVIVENDGEWLIQLDDEYMIHIAPRKFIALKIGRKWHISSAPKWRGKAKEMAMKLLYKYLPRHYYYLITQL